MNGYEMDVLSPRKESKIKTPSSRQELNATTELEGNQQDSLKSIAKHMQEECKCI